MEDRKPCHPISAEWQAIEDQVNSLWRAIRDDPPSLVGLP
jgi:hypothetical protein